MPNKNPMPYILVLVIVVASVSSAVAQDPKVEDATAQQVVSNAQRLFYGSDSLQFGDLRLPDGPGPYPVAMVIHGGCYLPHIASLDHTSPLADSLRSTGIATWNIEYNRVGHPNGGWPGTFTDVATATDFLRQISDKNHLALDNTIVIGHSAGAHLALWVAARHKISSESDLYRQNPLAVKGVVALSPPVDLERNIGPSYEICGDSVINKLLGGLPDQVADNYNDACPMRLLPIGVPQRILVGENDIPIILEHTAIYSDSAKKLNENIRLDTLKLIGHQGIADPESTAWPAVISAVKELLDVAD